MTDKKQASPEFFRIEKPSDDEVIKKIPPATYLKGSRAEFILIETTRSA
jgi:hypothetical protein